MSVRHLQILPSIFYISSHSVSLFCTALLCMWKAVICHLDFSEKVLYHSFSNPLLKEENGRPLASCIGRGKRYFAFSLQKVKREQKGRRSKLLKTTVCSKHLLSFLFSKRRCRTWLVTWNSSPFWKKSTLYVHIYKLMIWAVLGTEE